MSCILLHWWFYMKKQRNYIRNSHEFFYFIFNIVFFIWEWLIRSYKRMILLLILFSLHISGAISYLFYDRSHLIKHLINSTFSSIHAVQYYLELEKNGFQFKKAAILACISWKSFIDLFLWLPTFSNKHHFSIPYFIH